MRPRIPRHPPPALALSLLLAASLAARAHPSLADAEGGNWLSPAWPLAALAVHTGLTAGTAAAAGWPVDDAMLRYAAGMAAGSAPGALLLWLWGIPCAGTDERTATGSCWVEAALQATVVALLDASAMFATMLFVADVPGDVRVPSAGLTAGWIAGWTSGTTVALVLPPLLGAGWGEDIWSLVGLFGWTHGAVATALLAAVYAIRGEGAGSTWSVQLPLVATEW
ncbi:MAG: hypothetical protein HY905_26950 [Deltaproteobacteria bacterium]|nr:hypothetical protein [Deltaproteobacteria bacterium]